ncbi:hypothetical protein [Vibrio sp. 11-4(1)]|uniref:hypothetical protein n=1 Tax=Vibrio sp. 11-4(1) TaxID=2591018 RepID=UPI0014830521|nr:hypothetical protein [Vibrio sp. 11-4(1)]NNN82168.1 hypothetical protein [Vibrio sp. 11-4(1)]
MTIEQLTPDLKLTIETDVEVALRECLGQVASFFVLNFDITEYREDDEQCHLYVEIMNNPMHLKEQSTYVAVLWTKGEAVQLLVGEDEDTEWALNAGNLFALMYCWAFCKEE